MADRAPARRAPSRSARPRAAAKASSGSFSYLGETYRLDSKLGIWPMIQFARAAEAGWRSNDLRGMAAIHAFLQDVMLPEDWPKFQDDMINKKMQDIGGLLEVVRKAVDESLSALAEASGNGDSPE